LREVHTKNQADHLCHQTINFDYKKIAVFSLTFSSADKGQFLVFKTTYTVLYIVLVNHQGVAGSIKELLLGVA